MCQSGQVFDLFIDCPISGDIDAGAIFSSDNSEVTHKMNQLIGIDFIFENFDL